MQLKFKLRSGIHEIRCDLHREMMASANTVGSLKVYIISFFHCPAAAYIAERQRLYKGISIGIHDEIFNISISDYEFALCALLGDSNDVFNTHFLRVLDDAWVLHQRFFWYSCNYTT